MNTEQNGSTTTEQASQQINVTEKLFADLLPPDEVKTPPAENKEAEVKDEQETKKEVVETPAPKEPEYLDVQGFGDKKVKNKSRWRGNGDSFQGRCKRLSDGTVSHS